MNTRLIAARVLVGVIEKGQSLTVSLETAFEKINDSKEKAFVQALCYGVCRHYHTLHCIIRELTEKPIKDPEINALALVGLYQLRQMRVKPYAAVSETVLAANKKPWAKGLLNALLRTYLREPERCENAIKAEPSAVFSHASWLIQRLEKNWSSQQVISLLSENNQQPPMILRVNTLQISRDNYLKQLAVVSMNAYALEHCPTAICLDKAVDIHELPHFNEGFVSVQDSAAQFAAQLLDVKPQQRVLDLCAAPGGKTAHLLEHQPQLKELVAVDCDANRMNRVRDNLHRLKLNATLIVGDAMQPQTWWNGELFERILVDAPCSALGVVRRHPDIKLLRRASDIEALCALQKAILESAWTMLAPNGVLLYATCSVLKQENEQQIELFLNQHADAEELPILENWGVAQKHGRQILTGDCGMDGFYYAKLRKMTLSNSC